MNSPVRQAAILLRRAEAPAPLLRELVRFGVEDLLLLGDAVPLPALPRDARLTCLPATAQDGLGQARSLLQQRFLLCTGDARLDFNLAPLLVAAAPCFAMRDGIDAGVRLLDLANASPARPLAITRLPAQPPRPALFLDRDGTINVDHGYVGTRERFEWLGDALGAIRLATQAGWHVFVVTNQSGIARGFYDEATLIDLHRWMAEEIHHAGGNLDDVRFCPFHEAASVARYRRASPCRKPAPGMILDLIARWSLDPARCVLVGDQVTDMQAASAAGIAGVPFDGGSLAGLVDRLLHGHMPGDLTPRS